MQPIHRVALLLFVLVSAYLLSTRKASPVPLNPAPDTPTNDAPPHSGEPVARPRLDRPVFKRRLVAVGDLHGDLNAARRILRLARVLAPAKPGSSPGTETETETETDQAEWCGGDTVLVQTGDIVDRGTHAWDIYALMRDLRGQAAGVGGRVVSVLGNHEVMNAIGDWRYVTKEDIAHTGGYEQRMHDMSSEGWLGKEWLANYSTTALVSLHPSPQTPSYSFTHGSLRPSFPHLLPYPARINALGHALLTRALTPPLAPPYPPNPYRGLPEGVSRAEEELYDAGGPYWWRGLAEQRDERVVCRWAGELRDKLGARRIIGGHTPNFERIVDRCNASVIIIDTGMSSAYGGVLSALEIVYTLHALPRAREDSGGGRGKGKGHHQDPFVLSNMGNGNGGDDVQDADRDETEKEADAGIGADLDEGQMRSRRRETRVVETETGTGTGTEPRQGETYWEREEVTAIYEKGRQRIIVQEGPITL